MTVAIGTRIGPYEIIAPLGAGAMGEVYRARDHRLQRDLAIKMLPNAVAGDPERRSRFEREARVLASLNHPHIASIYGVEDFKLPDGSVAPALVMELVEGETLADVLARRSDHASLSQSRGLPIDDAVALGAQIAEALEAAHDKGIIHRDLKPANVKLTPEGVVKVLDFGLAKALDPGASSSTEPLASATLSAMRTADGLIMGTAAYMSPEQARGKAVDRRSDIWAFGSILYEMLTGARAFPGETISDTLAAVLTSEPDWAAIPRATPSRVHDLIKRCLERDPRRRLQAIGEARILLSEPAASLGAPSRTSRRSRATSAALVTAVAIAAGMLGYKSRPWLTRPAEQTSRMLDLAIEGLENGSDATPVISPDGRFVAYRTGGRLWVRALDEFTPKPLEGTDGATYPFWSPDSHQVAFVRESKVWRTRLDGTSTIAIGAVPPDVSGTAAGVWTAKGDLVLAGSDSVGLFAVSASTGTGRELIALDHSRESDFHEVSTLPDGRGLLFTVHHPEGTDTIDAYVDGQRKAILRLPGETLRSPIYSPAGYLLYARETVSPGIWAVRFSPDRLQTEGEPVLLIPNASRPSLGADGTLEVLRASELPSEIVSLDRAGSLTTVAKLQGRLLAGLAPWPTLALSPDGERLAVVLAQPGGGELWSYNLRSSKATRLSVGAQVVLRPQWVPDGSRVIMAALIGTPAWNLFVVPSTTTSKPEPLLPSTGAIRWPCTISPDGKLLVFGERSPATIDLWQLALDGTARPTPLIATPTANETDARFSPDGRRIVYTSDQTGRTEVYLSAFPLGTEGSEIVSNEGGFAPTWSGDGRMILFRSGNRVMAVTLSAAGSKTTLSSPTQLFSIPANARLDPSFAVSPDAGRVLLVRAMGDDRVSVVLNWTARLHRLEER
jgi:eukaryotic-like serine/threonine-protein kinase